MSDTLVIGGGIIGLLTARELVSAGIRVTLVEMGETGREASWAGGGIISPLYPWRYADSVTALVKWSQQEYPHLCTRLYDETGIDPEHVNSGMIILDQEEESQAAAWSNRNGFTLERLDTSALHEAEPGLGVLPSSALYFPNIAQVRNPRLTKALHRSLEKRIELREQEEVVELTTQKGKAIGVRTTKATLYADRVVICAGAWTGKLLEQLDNKPQIRPVRGQMILFFGKPGQINHVVLHREHYVIPRQDGRVLAGSTLEQAGFVKATTAEAKEEMYREAVELFPLLKRTPIEDHWAGLRPGSPSGIPYIGMYPGVEGLYLNAGHFRNGVVSGPASARLVTDLMLGRPPIVDPTPYGIEAER